MTPLLLLAAAHAAGLSLEGDYQVYDGAPPPAASEPWNAVTVGDLVVVRPPRSGLPAGYGSDAFDQSLLAAVRDREHAYDVVLVVHTDALPDQFDSAAAFHRSYNNADVWGTGRSPVTTPDFPFRSGVWMNDLAYWDLWEGYRADWVFCHEMGHQWLAFPQVPVADGDPTQLLGRQRAHWSYWVSTDNSPMEGNAWRDNGDGTFTTGMEVANAFTPLDLYLMGLVAAEDVPPVTILEPLEEAARSRESAPEHLWGDGPVTLAAAAASWTIEDLVAANGAWESTLGHTAAAPTALMVLVLAPGEPLTDATLALAGQRRAEWLAAWAGCTDDRSDLLLGVIDEGGQLPEPPAGPALVPTGLRP